MLTYEEFAKKKRSTYRRRNRHKADIEHIAGLSFDSYEDRCQNLFEFHKTEEYQEQIEKDMPSEKMLHDMYDLYVLQCEEIEKDRKESRALMEQKIKDMVTAERVLSVLEQNKDDLICKIEACLKQYLRENQLFHMNDHLYTGPELDMDNLENYVWDIIENRDVFMRHVLGLKKDFLMCFVLKKDSELKRLYEELYDPQLFLEALFQAVSESRFYIESCLGESQYLDSFFTEKHILALIRKNKRYTSLAKGIQEQQRILKDREEVIANPTKKDLQKQFLKRTDKLITRTYMESLSEQYKDNFVKEVKDHVCRKLKNDELYVIIPSECVFDEEGNPCFFLADNELDAENMDLFIDGIVRIPDYCALNIIGYEKEYDPAFSLSTLYLVKTDPLLNVLYQEACRLGVRRKFLDKMDSRRWKELDLERCMEGFFSEENILSVIFQNPRYEKAVQEYVSKNNI